jgi:hypothetical protein
MQVFLFSPARPAAVIRGLVSSLRISDRGSSQYRVYRLVVPPERATFDDPAAAPAKFNQGSALITPHRIRCDEFFHNGP